MSGNPTFSVVGSRCGESAEEDRKPMRRLVESEMVEARDPFELEMRRLVDSKYMRPAKPDNPIRKLINGELSLQEVKAFYLGLLDSLDVFNRVLISRLLETAPNPEVRSEVLPVLAVEFGPPVESAHPTIFWNFLKAIGSTAEEIRPHPDLENGPCREEVALIRNMSWCELLARILVGETQGPVVFPLIANALKRHYGLKDRDVFYFTLHAAHDKRDTEILFRLLVREARTAADRKAVIDTIERTFDQGRYKFTGCRLEESPRYSYAMRYISGLEAISAGAAP
jgi:pyrroloquinoline quinone (PQQ) biosynthesis protein C